jgi:hypothetical protein
MTTATKVRGQSYKEMRDSPHSADNVVQNYLENLLCTQGSRPVAYPVRLVGFGGGGEKRWGNAEGEN